MDSIRVYLVIYDIQSEKYQSYKIGNQHTETFCTVHKYHTQSVSKSVMCTVGLFTVQDLVFRFEILIMGAIHCNITNVLKIKFTPQDLSNQ